MFSSGFPLSLKHNSQLQERYHRPQFPSDSCSNYRVNESLSATFFFKRSPSKSARICFAFSSKSSESNPGFEQEEARWLREEQRWLREEQRWLREQSRWNAERESLLRDIQALKLRIEELERLGSVQETALSETVAETVANISKLLQVLKEGELGKSVARISDTGSSAVPLIVVTPEKPDEIIKEVVQVSETVRKQEKKMTLRKGSEGDEVRAMQEALLKLGFFCGEEDLEFSSFSSGTERAVKTWQATLGTQEDGVMTSELLERLYMEEKLGGTSSSVTVADKSVATVSGKSTNGVPAASLTEISEVQERVVKDDGVSEYEVSEHRVFLLGENRWEEPSRLRNNTKQVMTATGTGNSATKCLSCRGEGRLLCMECDGSGEPNIEEQFLEWVDEGAKCPYCDGLGYITCDVCNGKKVIET